MGDRLKGKVAIVTGAGSLPCPGDMEILGNGKAASILYAREGARILAVDINKRAVEETKKLIEKEGGICSIYEGDVSRAQDCQDIAQYCLKVYDRIDILHNNVGIQPPKPGGILELDEDCLLYTSDAADE